MANNAEPSPSDVDSETAVFQKLMGQDDFPATKAVEEIAALCLRAATSGQEDALRSHANRVSRNIYRAAIETAPSQQLKLVGFVDLLQQRTVFNPQTGEVLESDGKMFWTRLPGLSLALVEHNVSHEIGSEKRRNFTALLAQLFEAKNKWFSKLEVITYFHLVWPFKEEHDFDKDVVQIFIQVACIWLIYAPRRVWENIQKGPVTRKRTFSPAHWDRLKQVLEHSQGEYLDECTQDLIWQALGSMKMMEKKAVDEAGTQGSTINRATNSKGRIERE